MLGRIAIVTITTADLDASVDLYRRAFGYRLRDAARIPQTLAHVWGRPAVAGRRMALIEPESGHPTFVRFVESPPCPGYGIFRTLGWNALELIVRDVDALAERLATEPLRILGPPADLSFSDQIRAMQVVGPSGEVLYLTMIKSAIEGFDLPVARSHVDRPFIVILGGTSLDAIQEWFGRHFALPRAPQISAAISVLSAQYGLPPDLPHEIAAIPIGGQCYLEADQMPSGATTRESWVGDLPPGIAMVSFELEAAPAEGAAPVAAPMRLELPPYDGRCARVVTGSTGELIELIG